MNGFEAVAALPTDEWVRFLAGEPLELRPPPLPSAKIQKSFVGASGVAALQEAGRFYDRVTDEQSSANLGPLLDFGCGWGRICRLFLRDIQAGDLIGVDVDPDCVKMCRDAMPFGSFAECSSMPPLGFPSGAFETVTAYSVFSHLAEEPFGAWLHEFRRVIRPGGRVYFTTLKMLHLDVWESRVDAPHTGAALATAGFDRAEWEQRAELGAHLFVPTGGSGVRDASFYGEAIVPRAHLDRVAGEAGFQVLAYDDGPELPQTLVELRAV